MKKITVYTSGCWDLLHIGHLNFLERARRLGDALIVGVNTDQAILDYKGDPPVIPFEERMRIVGALKCVDRAIPHTLEEVEVFEKYRVDIVVRNPTYGTYEHSKIEKEYLERTGRKIAILPFTEGISTTIIIAKIRRQGS